MLRVAAGDHNSCLGTDLLQEKAHAGAAVACLNEMVTDALRHVPHCLAYMERVRDWHIFRFCAIPQVQLSAGCCQQRHYYAVTGAHAVCVCSTRQQYHAAADP